MTAIELMARLNGEVLGHKIRAVVGSEIVVLARMQDTGWILTEQGQNLANEHSNEAATKTPRARKPKEAVETAAEETVVSDAVAVESADVAPEL